MRTPRPAEFAAAFALLTDDRLPAAVEEARRRRGLSTRAAAAEIGTHHNTIVRLERGQIATSQMLLKTIAKIVVWLEEGS
ncbi:MAG TPA: helix-turn-helix transcriptional regulator [Acidimicrobiales bacterium]|nr:helix-turn-helix transcriptional regulator [Acidimicrobiales bacterium]